ncbi:hypothetical protein T4A_5075 [Trichinella pseudospiralis]|uniref:Uncharacterized protein n=1 Tax=Trichinella pseudospiralis TaxID=6337 RepID=A0A0V1EMJ6_TRIPS|nr:hypothetical protein T4A_5075 [Trichinella pseudospiralis]
MTRSKSRTERRRKTDEKRTVQFVFHVLRLDTLRRVLTKSIFCFGDFSQINLSSARERSNPLKTGFWRCIMQITIAIKVRYYQ